MTSSHNESQSKLEWRGLLNDIPGWLQESTRPLPLELYRILCGVILLAYCVQHAASASTAVLATRSSSHAGGLTGMLVSTWLEAPGPAFPFYLGSVLCAAIILGVAPRIAALALLGVLSLTLLAGETELDFEDHIVCSTALWLALLPVGRRISLGTALKSTDSEAEANDLPAKLFVLHRALLYCNATFWEGAWPHWPYGSQMRIGLCALGAFVVFPRQSAIRAVWCCAAIAFHAWLALTAGAVYANALLGAFTVIAARDLFPRRIEIARYEDRPTRLQMGSGLALAYTAVCGLFVIAQLFGLATLRQTSATVLNDLGVGSAQLIIGRRSILELRETRVTSSMRAPRTE